MYTCKKKNIKLNEWAEIKRALVRNITLQVITCMSIHYSDFVIFVSRCVQPKKMMDTCISALIYRFSHFFYAKI